MVQYRPVFIEMLNEDMECMSLALTVKIRSNKNFGGKRFFQLIQKKRAATKNKFEQKFHKLVNNAFYGKTTENVRNRMKIIFSSNQTVTLKRNESKGIVY